jgi:hypothetical protein
VKRFERRPAMLVGLLAALLAAGPAAGDELGLPRARTFDLRFRPEPSPYADLATAHSLDDAGAPAPITNCSTAGCGGCRHDGFFADAEIGFMKVEQSDSNNLATRLMQLRTPGAVPPVGSIANGYDPMPRITLGYLSAADNLGVQLRFWDYDDADSEEIAFFMNGGPNRITHSWEATVFDLEVIRPFYTPLGSAMFSGGYRMAYYKEKAALYNGVVENSSVTSRFPGNGLTGALDARYPIFGGLSATLVPRFSLLLGNQTTSGSNVAFQETSQNKGFDARWIAETQAALNFERPMSGGTWFVRGGYEVQYWNDFVPPIGLQTDPSWTVFHGAFFTVGLSR